MRVRVGDGGGSCGGGCNGVQLRMMMMRMGSMCGMRVWMMRMVMMMMMRQTVSAKWRVLCLALILAQLTTSSNSIAR